MRRTALGAMEIAVRAKAERSEFSGEKHQRPADFGKRFSIITAMSLKGDVGKSTISVNLACELANRRPGTRGGTAARPQKQIRAQAEVA